MSFDNPFHTFPEDEPFDPTFNVFQSLNRERCEEGFGHRVAWDESTWPIQNWALAIAGESGELANLVKKCLRGDFTVQSKRAEILGELADIITYCDLAMSSLGAQTGVEVWRKFHEVSRRIGWRQVIGAAPEYSKRERYE